MRFDRESILAFAIGKPSKAFGARYLPFDEERAIARLPGPPFAFMDRVGETEGPAGQLQAGSAATVEYDVPADGWYFESLLERVLSRGKRGAGSGRNPFPMDTVLRPRRRRNTGNGEHRTDDVCARRIVAYWHRRDPVALRYSFRLLP